MKVTFACPHEGCGRSYQGRKNLQRHIKNYHNSNGQFTCKVCGKKLSSPQNFKEHNFIHTGEKPFKCEKCGMAFRQGSQLCSHKKIHNAIERKILAEEPMLIVTEMRQTSNTPVLESYGTARSDLGAFGDHPKLLPSFATVFPQLVARDSNYHIPTGLKSEISGSQFDEKSDAESLGEFLERALK